MKPDFLFELSWEAANKVGGIYTVLRTKAKEMVEAYGDYYVAVGPFFTLERLKGEFEEHSLPDLYQNALNQLAFKGIHLHWGKWLIPGLPHLLLIDFADSLSRANDIKHQLWEAYGIDSLNTGDDVTHPFVWAWCAGEIIERILGITGNTKSVAHFHEWLSGVGLLYLKKVNAPIKTVFTTHATVLGRSLAESGAPLYEKMHELAPEKEAYNLYVGAKYQTEKAAAKVSDALTTVSAITALEVEYFLQRKPDVLTPNGLDISGYPTFEEIALRHRVAREQMREFLLYYFLPYYDLDVTKTLFYFISGRYEMRNKGIDMFIKSLGKLNEKAKKSDSRKTIIALILIPRPVKAIQRELVENREHFRDMQRVLHDAHESFISSVMHQVLLRRPLALESIFGEERARELEIKMKKFRQKGSPPLVTHELEDKNDSILSLLSQVGLTNAPSDRVKVIYYPIYLSGGDGLLNLEYREVVMGSHFGVFPSYYEPWGYTPLEAGALGIASLTTDTSGFGQFVRTLQEEIKEEKSMHPGIYVLRRKGRTDEEVISDLCELMFNFAQFSRQERVASKIRARHLAEQADWKHLVTYYLEAQSRALGIPNE